MSRHDHTEYQEGCFRCDLSRDEVASMGEDTALVEQAREMLPMLDLSDTTYDKPGPMHDLLAGLADEVERLRDDNRRLRMEAGGLTAVGRTVPELEAVARAARKVDEAPYATAGHLAACFLLSDELALLDAGQHHRDDGCLDEVVRLSADAGLYDQGDET
jgi:hypothetical protein